MVGNKGAQIMPYLQALKNLYEKAQREHDKERAQVLAELIKGQEKKGE